MILVRDVFRLKFGKAKEARALLKEGLRIAAKAGFSSQRQLVDLTGQFYTLVLESTHASLAAWESAMSNTESGQRSGAPGTRDSSLWWTLATGRSSRAGRQGSGRCAGSADPHAARRAAARAAASALFARRGFGMARAQRGQQAGRHQRCDGKGKDREERGPSGSPSWTSLGAVELGHKGIVALLSEHHRVGPWWRQMITVAYEQERGLREKHQTPEGFQISVSKTIAAPVGTVFGGVGRRGGTRGSG